MFVGVVALLAIARATNAQEFTVTLEKAEAIELCEYSDEVILILDDQRQRDPNRQDGDGNYWRFGGDRPTTRKIGVTCLKNKPLNSSFLLRVEEEETLGNRHIGSLKATVVQQDGKTRLVFDDKNGLKDSGRMIEDGDVFWYAVLNRPDGKPGKYKLVFKITVKLDQ
jgi:hypothetical protein